jgi:predicted RNA-binding protein with PIN domain
MPYLIDGHNLIPKVPGLSLEAIDDEMQLVEMLQEFCRRKSKDVEVYFDNAPPGGQRARRFGRVTARFVGEGSTADAAIMQRLKRLGKAARNWTVVSSDRQVIAAARARHAISTLSEEFALFLSESLSDSGNDARRGADLGLSPDEVDEWLQIFGADEQDS